MRKHMWSTLALLVMTFFAFGSVGGNRTSKDEEQKPAPGAPDKPKTDDGEDDHDGLVLLTKTVQGTSTDLGMEITGTVVNRRSKALSYAQITFNVYDESGAQVGSALANINGLEPGGRWNFKAVAFTKGKTYKFSKLIGR